MEELYTLLIRSHATLFHLFQKTWVYHWNLVGNDFYQLHQLFGDQYNEMFGEIDRLGEHMRYLRIKTTSSLSKISSISEVEDASTNLNASAMVMQLLSDNKIFCDLLGKVSEESENNKSYATANLVQDLMETHGKFIWMLRSYLKDS